MRRSSVSQKRQTRMATAVRDQIVIAHLPMVKAIAIRVHENLPVHVDVDDLVHAGVLGLFDAVEKYNPAKNVVFHSYAKHRIKGAMLDSLRQLDWASRDLRKRQKQVDAVTRDLALQLGRTPSAPEVADGMGVDLARWHHMAMELRSAGLAGGNPKVERDPDRGPEFAGTPDLEPDHICERNQMRQSLDVAIRTLPERYQRVVFLYYTNDLTMRQIGDLLGVNESRISQIHKTALQKMAVALHSAGIHSVGAFQ